MPKPLRAVFDRRPPTLRQLTAIIRAVMARDPPEADYSSLKEAVKCELIRAGYDYPNPLDWLDEILGEMIAVPKLVLVPTREPDPPIDPPLTQAETEAFLRQLQHRAGITATVQPMPTPSRPRVGTLSRFLAQEILDSIARCEALEAEDHDR
jgi:hypothetical protein